MKSRLQSRLAAQGRRSKYKRRRRRTLLGIFIVLVCFAGIVWVLSLERFQIANISIEGLERTKDADIRARTETFLNTKRFYVLPRRSIWILDRQNLADMLKHEFSTLKSARVRTAFDQTLRVVVEEYDPWGVLCSATSGTCYWMDRAGVVFEGAPDFTGLIVPKVQDNRIYDIHLGGTYVSQAFMQLVAYFNEKAVSDQNLQSLAFSIDAKDQTLRVQTRAGWEILLLESNNPEEAYKNLQTAISGDIKSRVNDLEYIDLRFDKRIFYKFRNEPKTSAE